MKMLFDVHCHLSFPEYESDLKEVVEKALEEGVHAINSSVSPVEIGKALEISQKYDNVYWTLGLNASETDGKKVRETIRAIEENRDKIIGIGEVGLDYHWIKDEKQREQERENFKKFIQLSTELKLPLVVHSRNAEEDCLKLLKEENKKALMHCFSGTLEQAGLAVELGCLISIPTNVEYSKQKQKLAKKMDLDSIVLETDSPYLAPTPKTRNEPVNVRKSVQKIAELKKITEREIEKATTENAKRFFKLD